MNRQKLKDPKKGCMTGPRRTGALAAGCWHFAWLGCGPSWPLLPCSLQLPQPPLSCRSGGVRWSPACQGKNVKCFQTFLDGAAAADTKSKPPSSHLPSSSPTAVTAPERIIIFMVCCLPCRTRVTR
ncbi:chemokine-like protein TAFA-3 isoform X3 [Equus asinus]|uniref:chemokine-like protein TAFA-3 isoform X3 n=1 Tax=Equus asinus TaxID=9793 RepID=UPI0038F5EE4B